MSSATARVTRVLPPVDVALAALLAVAALVETLSNDSAPDPGLRATLAGLTLLTLSVRRTMPAVAAALFAAGMATESLVTEAPDELAVLVGCLIVAYSVAVHAPLREALLGGALLAMAVAIAIALDPSDSVSNIPPSVLMFVGLPFGVGLLMRRRQQHIAALRLEAEALAREADAAVDIERRRIARELHDVVSHAVTLISVQAEAGRSVIDHDPDSARRSLEAIGRVSREALAELSRLLAVLREDETGDDSGLANLTSLVEGVRAAGLRVDLEADRVGPLEPAVDRCAYRVIQEGLTNALRHTSSATVRVVVARAPEELLVTVTSEGRAHTSSYGGSGRGLAGLRERVTALGGTFEATSPAEDRFRLRAVIPAEPSSVLPR
jgi:signal transduction histidine kinase